MLTLEQRNIEATRRHNEEMRLQHAQRTDRTTRKALDYARIAIREAEMTIFNARRKAVGKVQDKLERASEWCNLQYTTILEVIPRLEMRLAPSGQDMSEEGRAIVIDKLEACVNKVTALELKAREINAVYLQLGALHAAKYKVITTRAKTLRFTENEVVRSLCGRTFAKTKK